MDLYINGTGLISAAGSNSDDSFLNNTLQYNTDRLLSKEPDYTSYIPPMQLRRMSKAVRMGIGAARIAMSNAGIEKPDALSIGTAMGCLCDTEVFLSKMVEQKEQMLTPTAFIQSTHNTVGGQIALLAGCHGHNLTYVHRGHSFEHAMINAQLYLNQHPKENILVGGIDELTDSSVAVLKGTGIYRKANSTEHLLETNDLGSIAGEGASFFIAGKEKSTCSVRIKDISLFTTKDNSEATAKLDSFLQRNELHPNNIDLIASGRSGDSRYNAFYDQLNERFPGTAIVGFKHLSGEYATVSGFALGLITLLKRNCNIPDFLYLNKKQINTIDNILLINNYMHYYSLWHLQT